MAIANDGHESYDIRGIGTRELAELPPSQKLARMPHAPVAQDRSEKKELLVISYQLLATRHTTWATIQASSFPTHHTHAYSVTMSDE